MWIEAVQAQSSLLSRCVGSSRHEFQSQDILVTSHVGRLIQLPLYHQRNYRLFYFILSCSTCQLTPRRNPSSRLTLCSNPSLFLAFVISKVRTCWVYRIIRALTSGSPPSVKTQYTASQTAMKKHTSSRGIFHTSCSVIGYPAALETKRAAP